MKSIKLGISLTLICLVFILLGVFSPSFIYKVNAAPGDSVNEPYLIEDLTDLIEMRNAVNSGNGLAYYKLTESLDLSSLYEGSGAITSWTPIGNITNPFNGYFDGNGKTIEGLSITYDETSQESYLGLFGVISNAEIKNLSVEVDVVIGDNGTNALDRVEIGAIAGRAENSAIKSCKIDFNFSANRIEGQSNTFKYLGEVVCGGAVGCGEGLILSQCSIVEKFSIVQEGNNIVNSYFGGAVGYMNGGKVDFVYIAPSQTLVDIISAKSGELIALTSGDADILINNTKLSTSTVAFGGLIGYAKNINLTAYNNIFSTLFYTNNEDKIIFGGVVGEMPVNVSEQPNDITYCKFLSIQNAFLTSLTAVGNPTESGYVSSLTNETFNAMPTLSFYTTGFWKELKEWNFSTVWKDSSIISYGGYFFPNLQCFSTCNIRLSPTNVIEFGVDDSYVTGYVLFYFINSLGNPIYENEEGTIFATELDFNAGDEVRIKAEFYMGEEFGLMDFKYYYDFTTWKFGENTIIGASFDGGESDTIRNANGYISTSSESDSIISFTASSTTEGIYGINIIGESVLVKISLLIDNEEDEETNFGSINQIIGSNKINSIEDFTIDIEQYQGGISTMIEAVNEENEVYVFYDWVDKNDEENIANIKTLTFELDNAKSSTLTKFYPLVVYSEEDESLVAEIICYFSNNTSELTLNITGNGSVTIDGGDIITDENYNENLINDRLTIFIAIPEEGYGFVGWYSGETLLSNQATFTTSIDEDSIIEAKFELLSIVEGTGLSIWAIVLIIVGSLLVAGIIVLIILRIKKKASSGYKNNYRY